MEYYSAKKEKKSHHNFQSKYSKIQTLGYCILSSIPVDILRNYQSLLITHSSYKIMFSKEI